MKQATKVLPVLALLALLNAPAGAGVFTSAYDDTNRTPGFSLPVQVTLGRYTCLLDAEARGGARYYWRDLTGDQVPEMIISLQGRDGSASWYYAATLIYALRGDAYSLYWVSFNGEYPRKIWFPDVNGDGVSEVVLLGDSGAHHHNLEIIGYGRKGFTTLFDNGTSCGVLEIDTDGPPTTITIGRENWDHPDFCYATSGTTSLLEVWRWDGRRFVFDPAASTTERGMTAREAVMAATDHFMKTVRMTREMDQKKGN